MAERSERYEWNEASDEVLLECVTKYPGNIAQAMVEAASILEIDDKKCKNRWYRHLSKVSVGGEKIYIPKISFSEVRESLDSFLEVMQDLQASNKMQAQQIIQQSKRLEDQSRIMRDMDIHRKELEESYVYILRVIEKARKMFIDDSVSNVSKVRIGSDGVIEKVD